MNRPQSSLDQCLSLKDILVALNAPISEEHAWAICYQCVKCFRNALSNDKKKCDPIVKLEHVIINRDGHVHALTIFPEDADIQGDDTNPSERTIIAHIGYVIYLALDYGLEEDEERDISPELKTLLTKMSLEDRHQTETDDEGIERDSVECEDEQHPSLSSSLALLHQECIVHFGYGAQEADSHYKAVCRALVAEAFDLRTFLEIVGTGEFIQQQEKLNHQLDQLNFADWSRLWMQVIRELRRGVQLKKISYSRRPIEFELTPYEILMEDIRSRRYKLNKVMVDGNIPPRVKKDAHAIILEFIRSRPPLRKASERKLNPPRAMVSSPREKLMESIKRGHAKLSPIHKNKKPETLSGFEHGSATRSSRRLIKPDYSKMTVDMTDEEEDDDEHLEVTTEVVDGVSDQKNPWQRTAYDLATQIPSKRASMRRHTLVVCDSGKGSISVPQSRPGSRQTNTPTDESLSCTLPEITWSRTSLQDDLLKSKQWQEECLSLTLEEIVHIRSVLTKAELESLPVEGRVKEDAERRKVCFLCMKTRFGIFGPWGQICKLCKRTVCAKCHSKMRIPTEHFSHVPVVALSPSMLSPSDSEDSFPRALVTKLMSNERSGVGSAPTSPKLSRSTPPCQMSTSLISDGPISLPTSTPNFTPTDKWRIARAKTVGRQKAEKLKGLQMTVCHDCKTMVLQIIKSSRTTRNNAIRNLTLDLSPVY